MKRIILITLLMVLIIPGVAVATDNLPEGWGAGDFPTLPNTDGDGYVMAFYHDSVYGNPHWKLYSFPSATTTIKYREDGNYVTLSGSQGVLEIFEAELVYDNELKEWVRRPFVISGSNPFPGSYFGPAADYVEFFNVNIVTSSTGSLWRSPNPFPVPPPVVSELVGVELSQLPIMIGLETQTILPIGLMVLVVFLVIFLVRWFLRLQV